MPERMLNEGEMRFFVFRNIETLHGNTRNEFIEYHTRGGNKRGSREDFAKRFVDLSEEHHTVRAYHSMDRDDVENKPYIELTPHDINIVGASSPTDYLYELAYVVQQEVLGRERQKSGQHP